MHLDQLTVIYFFALVAAIILHEISHGVVALWFGDDTARRAGRLTLNPIPHIDPFGSIILPAMGALSGIPVIGWAKPVPVNPNRMRNPRRDMLIVSLAGPATNLAADGRGRAPPAALYQPRPERRSSSTQLPLTVQIPLSFAVVNLFLGIFNLLPIPPLDGAALLERVMPHVGCRGGTSSARTGSSCLFVPRCLWTACPDISSIPFLRHLYSYVLR